MTKENELSDLFAQKARSVSAYVADAADMDAALDYAASLCAGMREQGIVAAPDLADKEFRALEKKCATLGIQCIRAGLRDHPGGVEVGLTRAESGIAETGTLVLDSLDEDTRLSTMLCDTHVCVLKKADITAKGEDLEPQLAERMKKGPDYTAFITGASRTADIERVLALGVHGPLELHILLMGK